MTPLSANSIFNSPSFLPQVPDKAGLSSFLSPADAEAQAGARRRARGQPLCGGRCRPATVKTPHASTAPQLRVFRNIRHLFRDKAATAGVPAAAEPAANSTAARAQARAIN